MTIAKSEDGQTSGGNAKPAKKKAAKKSARKKATRANSIKAEAGAKSTVRKASGKRPARSAKARRSSDQRTAPSPDSANGGEPGSAREPVAETLTSQPTAEESAAVRDPAFERPPLERDHPNRSWIEQERAAVLGDMGAGAGSEREPLGTTERAVLQGVELGYQVSDEHMRLGRQRAEQLGHGYYDQDPFARLLGAGAQSGQIGTQLVSMWFEMLSLMATRLGGLDGLKDQVLRGLGGPAASPFRSQEPDWPFGSPGPETGYGAGPAPQTAPQVSIETVALSPAEVTVRLSPSAPATTLVAVIRREGSASTAPPEEHGIRFEAAGEPGVVHVRVTVAAGSMPGMYRGQISDRITGAACGWLMVNVLSGDPR